MPERNVSPAGRIVADKHPDNTAELLLKLTGDLALTEQRLRDLVEAIDRTAEADNPSDAETYDLGMKVDSTLAAARTLLEGEGT